MLEKISVVGHSMGGMLAAHLIGWAQGPDKQKIATVSVLTYEMVFTQPVLYEFNLLSMPTLPIIGERDRTAIVRT